MGKRLFQEIFISRERTDTLNIPDLAVVTELDDPNSINSTYHTVHKSYFSKSKAVCPYCNSAKTNETKIRSRKFKDILSENGKQKVIDLVFHQRYFRCKDCERVFSEKIDFAEDGCRYTNRLSDLLAKGTLTQTYEKVCKKYGVPASKTSVGVIMRRRLRLQIEQLPPLKTPNTIVVFVADFYNNSYPVVLGIYGEFVKLIDVLSESSESVYGVFFSSLHKEEVKQVFIDPDEQLHNAVVSSFPTATIMISDECVRRYIRNCLNDIIKKTGTKCFVHKRYHTLGKDEKYLTPLERRQVKKTLDRCHRLSGAYRAYQDLRVSMESGWDIPKITGWVDDLPQYIKDYAVEGEELEQLWEFDIIKDMMQFYEPQISEYLTLANKPPVAMSSAIMGIIDTLAEMPYCIYDVLHARVMLNTEHSLEIYNDKQYRTGIPIDTLLHNTQKIISQIKKEKCDNGY